MTLQQILEAMLIPCFCENRGAEIACAPSFDAELRRDGDQIFVWIRQALSEWIVAASHEGGLILSDHVDNVLHEAMHALCGPESVEDEGPLMAVQWHVMHELTPNEFKAARRGFASYGHVWDDGDTEDVDMLMSRSSEIGNTDEFLKTKTWQDLVEQAISQDFLARRNGRIEVVWGHGVHAQWLDSCVQTDDERQLKQSRMRMRSLLQP